MNVDKCSVYYTYRNTVKLLLIQAGVYPLANASRFYYVLPFIHLFLILFYLFGTVGFVIRYASNLLIITKRLGTLFSFMNGFLKFLFMMIYHEDIKCLHKTLDVYFYNLINDRVYTNIVVKGINSLRGLLWTRLCLFSLAIFGVRIPAIILIIRQYVHHIEHKKYILPVYGIYPWRIQPGSFIAALQFILELLGCLSLLGIHLGVDALYTLYVVQMIGCLRTLSDRMLRLNSFQKNHSDRTIYECIHQYEIILECRNTVQKIFGPVILWILLTNAITLCVGVFQLSQITMPATQVMWIINVVTSIIIQTFMYSWIGTRLTTEDENYKAAIYAANWQGNKRLMTSVIIMLSQKPLILKVCHISVITIDIFLSVLNTSVSYFLLLRTLQEKN